MVKSPPANPMIEKLTMLSETTPGTSMGTLLRRFWQPVFRSEKIGKGKSKPVKVMGEELVIYRGDSGRVHLVGGFCPHRRTLLHTGWVQGDKLRCMYHGWQFDGQGRCVERPAEDAARNSTVKIPSYPTHEYGGLVFAYMGDGPAPDFDLPRKSAFEKSGVMLFAREETWPCSWLQMVENSLDAVHVSFVHHWGTIGTFGEAVAPVIPKLEYVETDAGVRQTATRSANSVRISDWTFPNNNHIIVPSVTLDDPWIDISIWSTPIDDTHATRFIIYGVPSTNPEGDRQMIEHFTKHGDYNPADFHDEIFYERKVPSEPIMQLTSAQDYVAAMGQGPIADRLNERLGVSDQGVVFLRRLFWRETDLIREDKPTKTWHRIQHVELPKQTRELEETA
jgi:5,5'-dehydrodivanillate O-demethylase